MGSARRQRWCVPTLPPEWTGLVHSFDSEERRLDIRSDVELATTAVRDRRREGRKGTRSIRGLLSQTMCMLPGKASGTTAGLGRRNRIVEIIGDQIGAVTRSAARY